MLIVEWTEQGLDDLDCIIEYIFHSLPATIIYFAVQLSCLLPVSGSSWDFPGHSRHAGSRIVCQP